MTLKNNIGWCDATTNAVTGCDKVSTGCKHCYAEAGTRARVLRAQGRETWGPKGERVAVNFEPVFRRLNKLCVCDKCHTAAGFEWAGLGCIYQPGREDGHRKVCDGQFRRIRLFADSNSDWLDPKWPVETLARFLDAIRLAPNVDVLLLTKRIELWSKRLREVLDWTWTKECPRQYAVDGRFQYWLSGWHCRNEIPPNVWLGVSVEDQKRADERIPRLFSVPAAVRFLSVEPLLEPVTITPSSFAAGINWVIVGGESGKDRRDCGPRAIESVVEQCVQAGVPVYCKQDSHFLSGQQNRLLGPIWNRKEFPSIHQSIHP